MERAALAAAARTLAVDGMTDEVVSGLRDAGIRSVMLKGPALTSLLYADGAPREYVDLDLLVGPHDQARAEDVLADIGFRRGPEDPGLEGDPFPHGQAWVRERDLMTVDLHRTLAGVGAPPEQLWRELSAKTGRLRVGAADVEVLAPAPQGLVLALHARMHERSALKPLEDLRRGVEVLPEETWRDAAALANRVGASMSFAHGLRVVPEGAELADRLGLPTIEYISAVGRAGARPRLAAGLQSLAAEPGVGPKLGRLLREVFPPPAFMRWWAPIARRGPLGLALAYPWRCVWLLWHVGPSLRMWWRTREGRT